MAYTAISPMKITRLNNLLFGLIILINAYIIAAPLLPALTFRFEDRGGNRQRLQAAVHPRQPVGKNASPVAAPQPNHLIIPAMLLDQPVREGTVARQYQVLNQGIWHWPRGSTPDKGGNTILIGHRFTYTNPRGVFYYLNKLQPGDEIGLVWNNKTYSYRVSRVAVVLPTDTAIEDNTASPELTLFTCTPLWLPKNRLVVVANLETRP